MIRSFNENKLNAPSWWNQFRKKSSFPTFSPSPISSFSRNTLGATNQATGTYFDPNVNAYLESSSGPSQDSGLMRTPTDVYREEQFNEAEVDRQRRLWELERERERQGREEQRRREEMLRREREDNIRRNKERMRQGLLPSPGGGGPGGGGIGIMPPGYGPTPPITRDPPWMPPSPWLPDGPPRNGVIRPLLKSSW